MGNLNNHLLLRATAWLALASFVFAHSHDDHDEESSAMQMSGYRAHGSMNMTHPTGPTPSSEPVDPSYFSLEEHSGLMFTHIGLMVLAWVVVLPIAVMLSTARSRLTVLSQIIFLIVNAFGVLVGIIYNAQTPDLYENNAHNKAGWIISFIACGWAVLGVVAIFARPKDTAAARHNAPMFARHTAEYQHLRGASSPDTPTTHRWSGDSGQGTERNTNSLCDSSRTNSWASGDEPFPTHRRYHDQDGEYAEDDMGGPEKPSILHRSNSFFSRKAAGISLAAKTLAILNVAYGVLDKFMLLLGFVLISTGAATYGGIGKGGEVFSVAAHFVKGGIFFWYGLLTFGRWMGCFAEFGWAWNVKPGSEIVGRVKAFVPSAEFTESFVIFFYGASNVFLEHLGSWGQAWSAEDLQHVSITVMFFGGGLLGMLIESSRLRKLLNSSLSASEPASGTRAPEWQAPPSYSHSLNPMPAIVIMLLGLMMSAHSQTSMVASMMHKQWGTLFTGFAMARGVTYVMMWLKPPKSYMPHRPPSEIVAAFCLVSGGVIFMASNSGTVDSLVARDIGAMFVFTVVMGLTGLVMAWEVLIVAVKHWAKARSQKNVLSSAPDSSA